MAGYCGARYCYGRGVGALLERFAYVSRGVYRRGVEDTAEALAAVYRTLHALRARVIDLHETAGDTNEKLTEVRASICAMSLGGDGL